MTAPAAFTVYYGDDAVLRARSEPGALTSTAPPPPGGEVATHPFLSAAALDPMHEHRLREILLASSSPADFITRLEAAGYRVEAR
ncbi:MAG: hypothetical protein FJ102_24025 [Deltaproteobacteria bacterium]|nr:hypothetical protein [Deltaproteobacteria bacterium]